MRVVILGSGKGSNAEAILRAEREGRLGLAQVVQIFSDRPDAGILRLGERFRVPAAFVDPAPFKTKLEGAGEERFIAAIRGCLPDLVVLAGFMRVLKPGFLRAFEGKVINLHPSLLPSFPGLDGIGQALRAGVSETGCTVHYVTEVVDGGRIIEQACVPIEAGETIEALTARVHAAEHKLLPKVIARLSEALAKPAEPVFEFKIEVALGAVGGLEEWLAEREEQRLMLVEDKSSGRAWLTGYFASRAEALAAGSALGETIDPEMVATEPEIRQMPETDWRNSYKAHFKAWKFGRLNWVPVWERETFALPAGEEVLWLDPGLAFGTGNHETTRLCCERLSQLAEGTSGWTHWRAIDAGCGSGILALSAAKLGFGQIAAFDNDPEAVRVSLENAESNGLAGRVEFYVGDLVTGLVGREAELVMANIQADVLMRFAEELCGAVAPGGWLVLSGILERELDQVRETFHVLRPSWTVESRGMGEWAAIALRRPECVRRLE